MPIKRLLENYYAALGSKGRLGMLSDDFSISAGGAPAGGGHAGNLFFQLIARVEVLEVIAEGSRACALVAYELESGAGGRLGIEAAEIWAESNGRLASLSMYFDTAAYQKFIVPILFPTKRLKKRP
jgi:hypothetical protein